MTLHDDVLESLRDWSAPSASQEALRQRFVAHLQQGSDGVYRSCVPDHITASTIVLSADGSQVLLTLHAKANRWFQFGGHLEPDDATLAGAAAREAREESGIEGLVVEPVPVHLSEHLVSFCGTNGDVHHLDVRFMAIAPAGAEHAASDESLDVRWWPADALPADPDGPYEGDANLDLVELVDLARARVLAGG